jgi:oligopeptidase A
MEGSSMNPLLDFRDLPRFGEIRPEHVVPAIAEMLLACDAALDAAVSDAVPPDYEALSAVLDVATERLGRAWGVVGHLDAVADSAELRAAHNEMLPRVTEFQTRLGADMRLFAKYRAVFASPASGALSTARRQALSNALRDFVLSGAELKGAQRERFAQIQEAQAELGQKYSENVLDATDGYSYHATLAELAGVPEDVKEAAHVGTEGAVAAGAAPDAEYKLTLHYPSFFPAMQFAENRALRETLYTAYSTRASELGDAARDNSPLMRRLLQLRHEKARLLGYRNFAEVSLVPKMAEFARAELGIADLQAWDLSFASEKLKERRYAFSEQEVREYFTEPTVLQGLFRIIETLFDVSIRSEAAPVWHESVRFFRIERRSGRAGEAAPELVGQFYLDLYARPGKRPGAWMDDVRSRWARPDGVLQTPVAMLMCNFAPPVASRPALLSHDDVITLFHEFGHGLHHMLTRVDDIGVSGISGGEWDAVELPSQFMENFCWEWDVLRHMTSHVDSAEPLPRALFERMLAAKNFQSGMQTLRQVEFALVDMRLHAEPGSEARVQQVVDEVRVEVAVVVPPAFNRFLHSFSHIFAGGYAAGYYSYKWAEVLSADAFAAFEENAHEGNVLDTDTGRRYRENVLEAGGSRPALESFKAFRGREPSIDALLRHQGLA